MLDFTAVTLLEFKLATFEHTIASSTYSSDAAGKDGYYPVHLPTRRGKEEIVHSLSVVSVPKNKANAVDYPQSSGFLFVVNRELRPYMTEEWAREFGAQWGSQADCWWTCLIIDKVVISKLLVLSNCPGILRSFILMAGPILSFRLPQSQHLYPSTLLS
jgi:hypothetical protein